MAMLKMTALKAGIISFDRNPSFIVPPEKQMLYLAMMRRGWRGKGNLGGGKYVTWRGR